MSIVPIDAEHLVEDAAKRAGERFTRAMQKFIAEERKRRPNVPRWLGVCGAADGLGMALGAAFATNKPNDKTPKEVEEMLDHLLVLLRIRAMSVIEFWDKKGFSND